MPIVIHVLCGAMFLLKGFQLILDSAERMEKIWAGLGEAALIRVPNHVDEIEHEGLRA